MEKLLAALGQNSRNLSKALSADRGKNKDREGREGRTKGKRGAKKGHPGHHRVRVPAHRVDETKHHHPDESEESGKG